MAFPGSFTDLGKTAKEALFKEKLLKEFNTKDQFNVSNTSSNGVKVTGKLTREDAAKYNGEIELKFPKHPASGLEGSAKFDTKSKSKVSVSQSDRLVPGLKFTGAVEYVHSATPRRDAHLQAEYKRDSFNTSLKAIVPFTTSGVQFGSSTIEHQIVVGSEPHGVAAGVETKYNLASQQIKSLFVQVLWSRANWQLLGYSNDVRVPDKGEPSHACGIIYWLKPTVSALPRAEVAGEVEYDVLANQDNVVLALGFGWNPSENVRVQTKLDSRGNGTVIATHALNANTKLRAGMELAYDTLTLKKNFIELSIFD